MFHERVLIVYIQQMMTVSIHTWAKQCLDKANFGI